MGERAVSKDDVDEEVVRVMCVGPILLFFFYYLLNTNISTLPEVKIYTSLIEMMESHHVPLLIVPVCAYLQDTSLTRPKPTLILSKISDKFFLPPFYRFTNHR